MLRELEKLYWGITMSKSIIIERIKCGKFTLLAEIGVNYFDIARKLNISLMEAAKFMVMAAANAGVHGVKFQSYKAGTLAAKESPYYWDINEEPTKSQYELFKKFDSFGRDEYSELDNFCDMVGVEFCSTPFDIEAADYLEPLMNVYKISSSDLTNLPFIEYLARKGKPILLSVGAANLEEIHNAVGVIRQYNNRELILLHCVLEYPTPYKDANLSRLIELKNSFDNIYLGYSDHTKPDKNFDVIKTAYNLGAVLIEKHFTVDKALKGNDHYHAMDASDVELILSQIAFIDQIKGKKDLVHLEGEAQARRNARRSLVANCDIQSGEIISRAMLTSKRPGTGISPDKLDDVIGREAKVFISEDTVIKYSMLK